jgi:hypothetical protein
MEFKGSNGTMAFDGSTVTITRKGFAAAMRSGQVGGEKTIHISAISAVQYRKGGLQWGYIQLTIPGEVQRARNSRDLNQDENTVTFSTKGNGAGKEMADAINAAVHAHRAAPATAPAQPDAADQLRKLSQLHADGIITQGEFDLKRADLLNRM